MYGPSRRTGGGAAGGVRGPSAPASTGALWDSAPSAAGTGRLTTADRLHGLHDDSRQRGGRLRALRQLPPPQTAHQQHLHQPHQQQIGGRGGASGSGGRGVGGVARGGGAAAALQQQQGGWEGAVRRIASRRSSASSHALSQTAPPPTPPRLSTPHRQRPSSACSAGSAGGRSNASSRPADFWQPRLWQQQGPAPGGIGPARCGAATHAGQLPHGPLKENQDRYFIFGRPDGVGNGDFVCGVIDGHGDDGHKVSEFIRQRIAPTIVTNKQNRLRTEEALERAFIDTADALSRERGIDARCSGATCAVCLRRGNQLYVANAGDSRAVLACEGADGRLQGMALTTDHKPTVRTERARIVKQGGNVEPIRIPGIGFAGPPRVWETRQIAGGLAVSRAIGDTSLSRVGVTPQPEVARHRLRAGDRFIIVASDGCWDHMTNDRAVEIAQAHVSDPQKASEAILREARSNWKRDPQHTGYVDDITCVVAGI